MSVSQLLSGTPAGLEVPSVETASITCSTVTATAGEPLNLVGAAAGVSIGLTHSDAGEVRIQPTNDPPAAGSGANLVLFGRGAGDTTWEHYATGTTGGGLTADQYSLWGYPAVGFGKPYWQCPQPTTVAGQGVMLINPGFLDLTRTGEFVATGGADVVPVNSIRAGSQIVLVPVAGAAFPAAVPVLGAIVPALTVAPFTAGSFAFTGTAGVTYRYTVLG